MWNDLSEEAKNADSINSFKRIIDDELNEIKYQYGLTQFLKFFN